MLYELTPSKELTGGVWYSGLEFDHEFISELRNFVMHCVRGTNGGKGVTLDEIMQLMAQHNVSKVKLNVDEMKQLVETLVYDYHLEATSVNENGDQVYTRARPITAHCDFKWWDILSPDFPFRAIKFEDEVTLQPHEPHHHTV
jgi:DNA-directed RNA polymerase III subunit RPC6